MPPFDFGDAFVDSFTAAHNAFSERRQQRALNRIRLKRIKERARRHRKQRKLERMQMILGSQPDRPEPRVEVPVDEFPGAVGEGTISVAPEVALQLKKDQTEAQPRETIEVNRQNVEGLPGSGPANVDPDTLIRHRGDEANGQNGSSADGDGNAPTSGRTFDSRQDARRAYQSAAVQEQRALDDGVSKDSLAAIQDRMSAARSALDSLSQGRPDFFELRQKAMADTTRTDTTATRPDTTGTDSTRAATTRGLGRTGEPSSRVTPPDLSPGGNPGGGSGTPSGGGNRLRFTGTAPPANERLIGEAFSLAMEKGPQAARRRLDTLVQSGRLDPARRDPIIQGMRQKRSAVLDTLRKMRRNSTP